MLAYIVRFSKKIFLFSEVQASDSSLVLGTIIVQIGNIASYYTLRFT
ncbi:hypothetical protein OKW21_005261 [Catalinimonas alkaloidigena]|nr:hypothetical protein [Catalinimonas alkaloidigena]